MEKHQATLSGGLDGIRSGIGHVSCLKRGVKKGLGAAVIRREMHRSEPRYRT